MVLKNYLNIFFDASVHRPAWTQDNLEAYKNKYVNGKVKLNYYTKRKQK